MKNSRAKTVVVFDVCGTLYEANTTMDYIEFVLKNSRTKQLNRFHCVIKSRLLASLSAIVTRTFGVDPIKVWAVRNLRGLSKSYLYEMAEQFYSQYLEKVPIAETGQLLERTRGCEIVLASSSLDIVVQEIAKRLNISTYFASETEFHCGIFTGKLRHDLVGKKHEVVDALCYENLIVCTDNKSDLRLLRKAERQIVICTASSKNWWSSRLPKAELIIR